MSKKKRHWLWNIIIVLTLTLCLLSFVAHYKNWYTIEKGEFKMLSGIYYKKTPMSDMDSIRFVDKLPEMERSNGFSWMAKEKGIFKDSLTQTKIHVFVDDLRQQKIKLIYNDSTEMFLNFKDSLETQKVYQTLKEAIQTNEKRPD